MKNQTMIVLSALCVLTGTVSAVDDPAKGFAKPIATATTSQGKPLVGAIRWDAWQENGGIQAAVEKTLGPNHWHYRLPFFARVTGLMHRMATSLAMRST